MVNLKEFFLELKEAFDVRTEELIWMNSPERRELACERIAQLRAFTSGESNINPYGDLYDE